MKADAATTKPATVPRLRHIAAKQIAYRIWAGTWLAALRVSCDAASLPLWRPTARTAIGTVVGIAATQPAASEPRRRWARIATYMTIGASTIGTIVSSAPST